MAKDSTSQEKGEKLIAKNSAALHNFTISELIEAGLVLTGTEVKSMRMQSPNLRDSFVEIRQEKSRGGRKLEAFLLNAHVAPYQFGNIWNHDPLRKRKLLLHRDEIEKLFGATIQKGLSLVPIRLYFKAGKVKIEIGLGKGKKKYDKRESIQEKSVKRDMDRAMKR